MGDHTGGWDHYLARLERGRPGRRRRPGPHGLTGPRPTDPDGAPSMTTADTWRRIHAERAALADMLGGARARAVGGGVVVRGLVGPRHRRPRPGRRRADRSEFLQGVRPGGLPLRRVRRPGGQASRRGAAGGPRPPAPGTHDDDQPPARSGHGDARRDRRPRRGHPTPPRPRPRGAGGHVDRAVADNYVTTNLLLGAKRRIAGLRLRATDVDWVHGDGPEVSGPLTSRCSSAMSGRTPALDDLAGDGPRHAAGRC